MFFVCFLYVCLYVYLYACLYAYLYLCLYMYMRDVGRFMPINIVFKDQFMQKYDIL